MSHSQRPLSATLVANLLTVVRLPLAGLIWLAPDDRTWVTSVVLLAGASDMLDGWSARRMRRWRWEHDHDPAAFAASMGVGAWLDPLCDKLFVVSAFAAITWGFAPPLWCVAIVLTREMILAPAVLLLYSRLKRIRQRVDFTADWPGKATTVGQFLSMALVVFARDLLPLVAVLTGMLGALAATYYIRREIKSVRGSSAP